MTRLAAICVRVILATLPSQSSEGAVRIDVLRSTIVAFFPPVTEAELSRNGDTNETLADFQFYAGKVREPLKQRDIDFHEVYAHSFTIRMGKAATTFTPGKTNVGYYFAAPRKSPRIEYGVMTDADLPGAPPNALTSPKEPGPGVPHSTRSVEWDSTSL